MGANGSNFFFQDNGNGTPNPQEYKTQAWIMNGYDDGGDVTLGDVHVFESLADAEALGITAAYDANSGASPAYPVLVWYHIKEFFRMSEKLGGGGKLYVMLVANTVTLTQMCDKANVNYLKKVLVEAGGKADVAVAIRNPADDYAPTYLNGIDTDVSGASASIVKLQALLEEEISEGRIIRAGIIEGRACKGDVAASSFADLTGKASPVVKVVIGNDYDLANSGPDQYVTHAAVGTYCGVLAGRRVNASPAWVGEGPNNASFRDAALGLFMTVGFSSGQKYIDKPASFWNTLDDKAYGFFYEVETTEGVGVYAHNSNTCVTSSSDYSSIENNRVVAKIARRVKVAMASSINGPVRTVNGKLAPDIAEAYADIANKAIDDMREAQEFSGGQLTIDPNYNVAANKRIKFLAPIEPTTSVRQFDFYINLI